MSNQPTPIPRLSSNIIERFWSKVLVSAKEECWPWQDQPRADGYGSFRVGSKRFKPHRIAFFLETGNDPGNLLVCHYCNNPLCCNPNHLYAGTCKQNLVQARDEARAFIGSRNGRSKVNEQIASFIQASSFSGRTLADMFGISKCQASKIKRRAAWSHI